jgi:hypothetical protein
VPDLQSAAHARCSRAQMAAVMAGLVSVGVVILLMVATVLLGVLLQFDSDKLFLT